MTLAVTALDLWLALHGVRRPMHALPFPSIVLTVITIAENAFAQVPGSPGVSLRRLALTFPIVVKPMIIVETV